jgi:hypothetical protein
LWHRRIGFVCQWLVLQDPEGCTVGRSALQVDGTWFNFGRGSKKETIVVSSRSFERRYRYRGSGWVETTQISSVCIAGMWSLPFTTLNEFVVALGSKLKSISYKR